VVVFQRRSIALCYFTVTDQTSDLLAKFDQLSD